MQRFLCKGCGYRFTSRSEEHENSAYYDGEDGIICRVCVSEEMKNLARVEAANKIGISGHATDDTTKLLFDYGIWLKKEGYAPSTIESRVKILKILVKRGACLDDQESIKVAISQQKWVNKRKNNAVDAYTTYLKMRGSSWDPPKYLVVETLPFIPTEAELDALIAGCGQKTSTFLQFLKETGVRAGEAVKVRWIDIDFESSTARITPEKGSRPRAPRLSLKLMNMMSAIRTDSSSEYVFNRSQGGITRVFQRQRRKIAYKLQNPRLLNITFHTFRHWKATTEYARTKDILYVMNLLGHKRIQNTLIYTQLTDLKSDDYTCKVATSVEEAKPLIEAGFEFVCAMQYGISLFRKRK